jgi:hypothetical protein
LGILEKLWPHALVFFLCPRIQILEWPPVYHVWKSTYFIGHVLLFITWFVVTYVLPRPGKPTPAPKKVQ